jgi:hypothetical protein
VLPSNLSLGECGPDPGEARGGPPAAGKLHPGALQSVRVVPGCGRALGLRRLTLCYLEGWHIKEVFLVFQSLKLPNTQVFAKINY